MLWAGCGALRRAPASAASRKRGAGGCAPCSGAAGAKRPAKLGAVGSRPTSFPLARRGAQSLPSANSIALLFADNSDLCYNGSMNRRQGGDFDEGVST